MYLMYGYDLAKYTQVLKYLVNDHGTSILTTARGRSIFGYSKIFGYQTSAMTTIDRFYLVQTAGAVPREEDSVDYQHTQSYYLSHGDDGITDHLQMHYEVSSEYPFHTVPFNTGEQMSASKVISANLGAELLVNFQLKAIQEGTPLLSYDDIKLSEADYNNFLEKLLNIEGLFHLKHNFSLTTTIYEFIKPDEFMIVLSNRKDEYSIERSLLRPQYEHLLDGLLKKMPKEPKVSWVTSIRDERPNITTLPIKAPGKYNPLAYPSIGQDLDEFIKGYVESSSNILLMYSPPGTGKTTLLKHLLEQTRESCLITYSEEIKNMDSLFAYFLTSNEKFLIIEDADNYLTARDKDANNHSMKKLLNITDGLTSNPTKKVIFTTNLPNLNQVDSALLRPGRCYKALYFPYLTLGQSRDFLRSECNGELPELFASKTFTNDQKFSLASLHSYLNGYDPETIVDNGSGRSSFGFTKG